MNELIAVGLFIAGIAAGFFIAKLLYSANKISKPAFDELNTKNQIASSKLSDFENEFSQLKQKADTIQEELQHYREKNAILETEKRGLSERIQQHKNDLEQMEEKFRLQFENLANRIFDEKTTKFKEESEKGLGQLLNPLREKLQDFQKKVDESFGEHAKEQFSLKREIERIVKVNENMTLQTENLSKALTGDVRAQGDWGEILLEKILEESGLRKGKDYIPQGASLGLKHPEDGTVSKPDIVVMLPDNKHVVIDSKVSFTHYKKYCDETDEQQKKLHLKDYLLSIRNHVNGLTQRRYQDTEKLGTPDFVLMFLPIEGAYSLAIQNDTGLHNYAWEKKIVIVCPTTLFATLRTVASIWKLELQNQNAQEIARRGGALYDKVAGFIDDMLKLGKQLENAKVIHSEAMGKLSEGRGNILRRAEDLKILGAKAAKSLPVELLSPSGTGEDAEEPNIPAKDVA